MSPDVPARRVGNGSATDPAESGMPTDKMQRFMDHAQSTVELRKKNGKVSIW